MRIVHFSDVHIGVENYTKIDPDTGMSTRLMDFLSTFDEVVSYSIDNDVDLVLFCGDAYKSREPSQTHQREFAKRINQLSSSGIPVFLLLGNHDMPHVVSKATALDIFSTLEVPNLYIGDSLKTYKIPTKGGLIQIVALPWIRRSAFLVRKEIQGLNHEEINESIQKSLTELILANAQKLDNSVPAIFAGHVSIGEAVTSSEQSMMLGRDHVLLKSAVALPQFDYVALGHVHRHQILGNDPKIVYSGSLQRVDFGEEKDDKGFCVLDIDPAKPAGLRVDNFEFKNVDAREFLSILVEIHEGDPNPTNTVIEAISRNHIDGKIVKLIIKLPIDLEGQIQDSEVRKALQGAHFLASISKEVTQQVKTRLGHTDSKIPHPKQALALYLESRNVPDDRAKLLIEHADGLIDYEDLE